MSKTAAILLATLLILSALKPVVAQFQIEPLIIFHIDMNSVSLREDYLREWLKKAAEMGYNAVLWEVEDEIRWKTCPECVSPDAFSKKQFRAILQYSRELGLEPIPLLQTIGHAEYVLRNKKYFSFREDPEYYDCYCTTNPEVRKFLKTWIREYLDLFGEIRYFHLGGDEVYRFGTCPKCSARVAAVGANQLYIEHMTDIAEPLVKRGIRPGIWSDMILKHPESLTIVPREFIFWDWNYWDGEEEPNTLMVWSAGSRIPKENITTEIISQFPEIVDSSGKFQPFYTSDKLKNAGYDVILCSSSRCYGDGVFAGQHDLHTANVIGAARKTVHSGLLGTCVTSWAVRIPNFETQYPWLYLGPLTIKNPQLSRTELLSMAATALLGTADSTFYEAIALIGYPFTFAAEKSTGIGWTGMKDGCPAPDGYIRNLIENWKTKKDGEAWGKNKTNIAQAIENIQIGTGLLNDFLPVANRGFDMLNAWSQAAYFQYWQAIVADEIVRKADSLSTRSSAEMISLLKSLKLEYQAWAETWMTKAAAAQNAGLIYDAIINYFQNCNYE